MKAINSRTFAKDHYYPKVVRAVDELLADKGMVVPVDVFVKLGFLFELGLEDWRSGKAKSLEEVLRCDGVKAMRLLEILRLHARDRKLKATAVPYLVERRGRRYLLRFSKKDDPTFEKAFSHHFVPMAAAVVHGAAS